jgi:undecaprenyl-diphosphatase
MSILESIILGILQGLTEFLPVSSSGHLELGKMIMDIPEADMTFTVVVHGATVMSTIAIFWREIMQIFAGVLKFEWNNETKYAAMIAVSMVPAAIAGLLFEQQIDAMFVGNLSLVASMLLVTGGLLALTHYAKPKKGALNFKNAAIMGLAQAIAIAPGISRAGATISTALMLGNNKEEAARFSFLMVVPLIIAANAKKIMDFSGADAPVSSYTPLFIGFVVAFITGLLACKIMLNVVKKGKLIWFSFYCFAVGSVALVYSLI